MAYEKAELVALTAEIVNAFVSNNTVAMSEVPTAIAQVFAALDKLGTVAEPPAPEKPVGAVSVRASIKPDRLISMIDGKSYKMLRRHITLHGYTPESYRAAFGLPDNYPMVAANYAEQRRALALEIGLGRKPKAAPAKPARGSRKAK
jgi:predicted transcriptional regulator